MNNDLISRRAVIDLLKESGIIIDDEKGNLVVEEIGRIPTDFDVDKVISELEAKLCSEDDANREVCIAMRNHYFKTAIEIVKLRGAV